MEANKLLRADRAGYMDLHDQQKFYEATTGDREGFIGFDARFAEWCRANPRASLRSRGNPSGKAK
jgi:hypothetical protein